ncbi:zinc transporter 10-like [Erpetoichthys calabaricus]|uniref:zinc transporter 10-like n=1 Tax=Erpetoichthys calabaricus TaxID=27687 RepID=UPI002233E5B7|nr:zinc transporter 10-like [Erpetoichthys calabaricus]
MSRQTWKKWQLIFMLVDNGLFFLTEVILGYIGNSVTLISDSFSLLSNLLSLLLAILTPYACRYGPSCHITYGLTLFEVVGVLCNAVFLSSLCFTIFVQSTMRLIVAQKIDEPFLILVMGSLGVVVNAVELIVFRPFGFSKKHMFSFIKMNRESRKHNETGDFTTVDDASDTEQATKKEPPVSSFNIRGVLLNIIGDLLGSLVVLVSALIFYFSPLSPEMPCNWKCYVDPCLSFLMVFIIMKNAFPLIKDATAILMLKVPDRILVKQLSEDLSSVPGVQGIHELHIWELSSGRSVASLHVKCADSLAFESINQQVQEIFHKAGVHSITIQPELTYQEKPSGKETSCTASCLSSDCETWMCCRIFVSRTEELKDKGETEAGIPVEVEAVLSESSAQDPDHACVSDG